MNWLTITVEALRARAELGLNVADGIALARCDDRTFVGLLLSVLAILRVSKYDIGASPDRKLLDRISGRSRESEVNSEGGEDI